MLVRSVLLHLFLVVSATLVRQCVAADNAVDFKRDIEPIFVKRCSECHGPDKHKGGLRLDLKAEAMKGGKSGKPAIAPGKSSESEIIRRVTTDDADDFMPPKGARLEPAQVAALRAWMGSRSDLAGERCEDALGVPAACPPYAPRDQRFKVAAQ
jgi:mono/diheme cytochrome c family protein